jgi:hypothetical protein
MAKMEGNVEGLGDSIICSMNGTFQMSNIIPEQ